MFELYKDGKAASIVLEEKLADTLSKVTGIFADDIRKVTGQEAKVISDISKASANAVIVGIEGESNLIEKLRSSSDDKYLRVREKLSDISGKNECYTIFTVSDFFANGQKALVIAGSDKRGAIYGMFAISEKIGVSPWHFFADANPKHKDEIILTDDVEVTSKEPSVRYRGLFINDEQPCFGNWAKEKYGSVRPGPELYEKIFELILRLKGNYIWPAMWRSDFTLDNIENARLANEMGIVVGASHHEPCCRSGQEFQTLNKTNPQYGKEWSFLSNAEGITEFWKDGLIRNKDFENLITIGMRGENDSHLMPADATLKDNIDVLKKAIMAQKELISEYAPSRHPQLLAIYKEVEDYYFGDENTEGLKDWDVLKDDIMMLCDDNFANVRTLPDEEMRKHPGGFGMYYHFDYFGGPVSYLWINSSPLTKVWDQLTMCYDFGIRSAWIVNVGDIKNQELPLSYFMDLAYDFDKWGTTAINKTAEYTVSFFEKLGFAKDFSIKAADAVSGYVKLNGRKKPEALNAATYHPVNENEAETILSEIDEMTDIAEKLQKQIKGSELEECFYQLVYYPVNAVAEINRMQIYAGMNNFYAEQGKKLANVYADLVKKCIDKERLLTDEYHTRNNGKWNHMQSVAHIGFKHWNEERWGYPVCKIYYPIKDSRLLVSRTDSPDFTHANRWNRHVLKVPVYMETGGANLVDVSNAGEAKLKYRINWDAEYISVEEQDGTKIDKNETLYLDDTKRYVIRVLSDKWNGEEDAMVTIFGDDCETLADESENDTSITMVEIKVEINACDLRLEKGMFYEKDGCISIEAVHFSENIPSKDASFKVIEDYGKTLSGVKFYPQTLSFKNEEDAPALKYNISAKEDGEYTCMVYVSPSNPVTYKGKMQIGIKADDRKAVILNTIPDEGFIPWMSKSWSRGVLDQIHIGICKLKLKKGKNVIKLFAKDPAVVVEKIVLWNPKALIRNSYLGPKETMYTSNVFYNM
ncbi:glycosyl hydrolase 115 family protein [Butyrivibrio sp. NC2002]|uniref:glycosyl hydrolase 115 family protein n=1 Tax=Butyrivibrio sp. NC2002 TaxID=1410610 RepID=UPI00056BE83F|nr:glycosyl hydrolase 115 family protein [Butyrivibrio sp. NC2002]